MRSLPDSVEFCAISLKLSSLKLAPLLRKKAATRMVVVMRRTRMAMATPRMFLSNCSFRSSLAGNWRFKENLHSRYVFYKWWVWASLEFKRRVGFFTAIVFFHNSFCFMAGHHIRRGAGSEVIEVKLLLVVEQGQVNDVAVMSPRSDFNVALLLILKRHNLQQGRQGTLGFSSKNLKKWPLLLLDHV